MKKKRRDYSKIRYDDLPEVRETSERVRVKSRVNIDYSVFVKSPEEKLKLKLAKARTKNE